MVQKPNEYDSQIQSRLTDDYKSSIESRLVIGEEIDVESIDDSDYEMLVRGSFTGERESSGFNLPHLSPLKQGIVMAELLGKPVSKRRSRGRFGI